MPPEQAIGVPGPAGDAEDPLVVAVEAVLRREAQVQRGEGVIAAVSGGVDSLVLLDALQCLSGPMGLHLCVAHLDHQMRSGSEDDARFVAAQAARRDLEFHGTAVDVPALARSERRSPEEAARRARYAFLDQVRLDTGSRWIALGHHADDQAETVLLHLLRGAGAGGMGAMAPVRADGYVRPLLGLRRAAIEAYALKRGLPYRTDPTNTNLAVPRNRIRHELLPELTSRHNPAVTQALCRGADIMRQEHDALGEAARTALETVTCVLRQGLIVLAAPQVVRYHIAIRRRLLREAMHLVAADDLPGDYRSVAQLLRLLESGGVVSLTGALEAQVADGRLVLRGRRPPDDVSALAIPGRTEIGCRGLVVTAATAEAPEPARLRSGPGGWVAAFDADEAGVDLSLRSWRPGDRLQPLGMEGRKKVSDLFIDARVPRLLRPEHPVLTRGEEILWVAGLRTAHPCRVSERTRRVLWLEIEHMSFARATDLGTRE